MIDAAASDTVLRFALATYAMKRRTTATAPAAFTPPPVVSDREVPSPDSPMVFRRTMPIHSSDHAHPECAMEGDDQLTALHECLRYLQAARDECAEEDDRETEAARVSQLLQRFVVQAESRKRLLRTLVDALVSCEEGEEDSPLIDCVSRVAVYLCYTSLTNAESDMVANDICEEACRTLVEALVELQEADFQYSPGGKVAAQTLDEIQSMLRVFFAESSPAPLADGEIVVQPPLLQSPSQQQQQP